MVEVDAVVVGDQLAPFAVLGFGDLLGGVVADLVAVPVGGRVVAIGQRLQILLELAGDKLVAGVDVVGVAVLVVGDEDEVAGVTLVDLVLFHFHFLRFCLGVYPLVLYILYIYIDTMSIGF